MPGAEQPFVALNCAAIPEGLVENELFGHERGAYTGAGARKIGKMELAHRGTIFLDEIAELPLAIQSKLLRVLEERRFDRVGGTQAIEVNVRIITATNKDLRAAVADKTFREDLYFRIAAVPITIPAAARTRRRRAVAGRRFPREDSGANFASRRCNSARRRAARLLTYAWPGNVRELQNAIERAAILATARRSTGALQLPAPRPTEEQFPTECSARNFCGKGRWRK